MVRLRRLFFLALFAVLVVLSGGRRVARAQDGLSVELTYFRAAWQDSYVLVEWETATEFDNAGFFVLSADSENGDYAPVSDFILAEGSGATGAQYSFDDVDVEPGTTYWYKLAAVALDNSEELHGPVSAVPPSSDTATPTATTSAADTATHTPTFTATEGPTLTPTLPRTSTPTRTNTPESYIRPATNTPRATSYPAAATNTPRPAATSNPNAAVGASSTPPAQGNPESAASAAQVTGEASGGDELLPPTPTLEPLPSLTIEFGGTAVALAGPQSDLAAVTRPAQWLEKQPVSGRSNLVRLAPLALIGLIWTLLAGWFVVTARRLD